MARPENISSIREKTVQPAAAVFESGLLAAHAKGHIAIESFDLQFAEQPDEVRVSPFIVDDEPSVHRTLSTAGLNLMRVRMAAEPVFFLEQ
jgi:hypothetical protein